MRERGSAWGTVGVAPEAQGRGRGTAVLRPGLEAAEAAGFPAFLKTPDARNVRFYERLGFTMTAEVPLPDGGPLTWCMTRSPGRRAGGTPPLPGRRRTSPPWCRRPRGVTARCRSPRPAPSAGGPGTPRRGPRGAAADAAGGTSSRRWVGASGSSLVASHWVNSSWVPSSGRGNGVCSVKPVSPVCRLP
ncbi:GNAT family N-acetyltransferase [Streptomyces flaveolus]|uniref:GNAT family N-acetyltransferase n=1 Tax=Streptomyces flaveolus TaxID=67297 RepID=UPI0037A77B49